MNTIFEAIPAIAEIIATSEYRYFGIRSCHRNWIIGQKLTQSYDALAYESDSELLPGTCCTEIEDAEEFDEIIENIKSAILFNVNFYAEEDDHIFLIAGNNDKTYGTDDNEIILESAVAIYKIK